MIQPSTRQLEQALADVDGMVRRLAVVLREISDFGNFFKGLDAFFAWVSSESGRSIRLERPPERSEPSDPSFANPELTAPVDLSSGTGGFIRLGPPSASRPFGPQDLHLLGALADFTGALLEVSGALQADRRMLVLLRFLFDQLPIGILCYDQDGSLLVRNARVPVPGAGGGWATRDEAVGCLEAQGARRSAIAPDHLQYVLSAGAGQSLVDLRRIERKSGAVYTIATFGPLSGQGDVFRERLEREVYRCRWLGSPLTLVVLRSGPDPAPLLARLPELRAALGEGAFCDVLDDSGLGLIAPLRGSRETLAATRRVAGLGAVNPLTLGWSGLVGAQEDPEAMIGRALDGLRPAGALLGRRLLVFDRYRAVPDMIEMVVGGALHLDKATDPDVAGRLLEDAPYDGLIADGDATENGAGIRLLELAACRQPAIRTILSTTRMDLRPGVGPVPDRTRILNKPFTLSALRTALEGLLKPQP